MWGQWGLCMSKASASLLGWGSAVSSWNKLNCRLKLKNILSDFGCLPACTSSLSYILTTSLSVEYLIAVSRRLDLFLCCCWLYNPEVCSCYQFHMFWGSKNKMEWMWVWEEMRFLWEQNDGKVFVSGFKYILFKRKPFLLWYFLLWFNLVGEVFKYLETHFSLDFFLFEIYWCYLQDWFFFFQ